MKIYKTVALSLCLLSGCMVGPDYERPETPAQQAQQWINVDDRYIEDVDQLDRIDQWWLHFGDDIITDLVRRALENNYNLEAAAARVMQAQQSLAEAAGARWPSLSYSLDAGRETSYIDLGEPIGEITPRTTTWRHDISVSYITDIFGSLRRSERAAWAQLLAARASEQALTNAVIANVVRARVEISTLQRELDVVDANIRAWLRTLDVIESRYEAGLVGPVDLRLARENLAAERARRPQIQRALQQAQHALDVLLGDRPASTQVLGEITSPLPELADLPIGVPAELLDRRPDVISAEMALVASNEQIGVSIANLYPNLTITGRYGRTGSHYQDLVRDQTEVYGVTANILQQIWQGGALRAQVKGARARYRELAADYAQTVLTAMQEVEDALVAGQTLQEQYQHLRERLEHARRAEELARRRYERGIETILTVLESERRRRAAENALITVEGQIWTERINLFLALGGDWTAVDQQQDQAEAQDNS